MYELENFQDSAVVVGSLNKCIKSFIDSQVHSSSLVITDVSETEMAKEGTRRFINRIDADKSSRRTLPSSRSVKDGINQ